jgi:hypothetical protein
MKNLTRLASVAGAATIAAVAFTVPASATTSKGPDHGAGHVVFVQNDNLAGNQIVAYDRSNSGALSLAGTYETGGLGGQLDGSVVDHLASQRLTHLRPWPKRAVCRERGQQLRVGVRR